MKYLLVVYEPGSAKDPSVLTFEDDLAAFKALESRTIANLGRDGVEVVLFYIDSEETLRSTNSRYFNPQASRRLKENPEMLRRGIEQVQGRLAALAAAESS